MTAFKPGDRVQVNPASWPHGGCYGVVVSTDGEEVEVEFGDEVAYQASELELAPAAPHTEQPPRATEGDAK